MIRKRRDALELGPDVIRWLLPHRRPLLMVDRVLAFTREPMPTLMAARHISANEEVFDGHFPGLKLWPGIYTIEGLGQSCNLLHVLLEIVRHEQERGRDAQTTLDALRNLELGYRLHPGFQAQGADELTSRMPEPSRFIGLSSSVEMKFLAPVFAGQCLEYEVRQVASVDQLLRWEVEARVEGQTVARGAMTARIDLVVPGSTLPGEA